MVNLKALARLFILVSLSGCASGLAETEKPGLSAEPFPQQAVLFVELEDGSVVRQSIQSSADYCFKTSQSSETVCFTEGQAILDPVTQEVIAYRLLENHLHLVAKH